MTRSSVRGGFTWFLQRKLDRYGLTLASPDSAALRVKPRNVRHAESRYGVGLALLISGLVMNVVGVVLSSSRDLLSLSAALSERLSAMRNTLRSRVNTAWARLLRKPQNVQVLSVSGAASATSSASGTVFAWNAVPEDASPEDAIRGLKSRTDSLHEMIRFESQRRSEDIKRLSIRVGQMEVDLASETERLETRIDEFDVEPAGQRATGALLVVLGSLLMFAGGLLGT